MRRIHSCVIFLLAGILAACGTGSGARSLGSQLATVNTQTVNNTSAATTFAAQSNGNLGANNVSKVDVHSLLYPGATTKILAHMMLWFGKSNHMNVGYNSNDAAQVQHQITDMISRGIDGVIIDWYGPNNTVDEATRLVMHEAEKHAGFTFAIMVDAGAMGSGACPGCNPEQTLIKLMQYIAQNYFGSKAYLNIAGEPVVTNFNVDQSNSINWDNVRNAIPAAPRLLFQDNPGFSHQTSDGSYSWIMPQFGNYGLDYLSSFYGTALGYQSLETVGATYKGFNDSLAGWGSNRVMNQQCGQTWLQTFDRINQLYSKSRQLPFLQLVTWNDYEEGTELESGIDSCFSLQGSISGNKLQWSIAGNENTVDHYAVYTASGQNLTQLTTTKPGTHSVNLCSLSLPAGQSQLYVQAVGKPMLANRMPAAVSYTPTCGTSN
jgi:Glycosyl hydrolase family 71